VGRAVLDLLLAPQCVACDAEVDAPGLLCADCFRQTGFITEPFCARCGVPFSSAALGGADQLCPACEASPPVFFRARAALRYDAQGRRLILPFKHADRQELASTLAPHMARAGVGLLRETDVLVPVPLHRARLFHRRYNQAALLATAVGRIAERPCLPDALQRQRPTESLGEKSAAERATEVAGAFTVRPSRVAQLAGKRVLLVDDVMTSGATANACATTLLAAGAATVDVLVAARVPDPRLN
jgi:ComF family protein